MFFLLLFFVDFIIALFLGRSRAIQGCELRLVLQAPQLLVGDMVELLPALVFSLTLNQLHEFLLELIGLHWIGHQILLVGPQGVYVVLFAIE